MFEAEDAHWWYRGLRQVLTSLLRLDTTEGRKSRILDAGCGTGGNLAALLGSGHPHVEGFDLAPNALHFCHARGLTNVRLGSITQIPFDDESFDIVYSCDVLNDAGTQNEAAALQELRRVLRPGGRVFLNVPAFGFLRSEHDLATDVARRYRRRELATKLKSAGFLVERVTYWNMLLFPVVILVRIVRRVIPGDKSKPPRSDINLLPAPLNTFLILLLRLELSLLRWFDLPVGSSIAVVARKPRRADYRR